MLQNAVEPRIMNELPLETYLARDDKGLLEIPRWLMPKAIDFGEAVAANVIRRVKAHGPDSAADSQYLIRWFVERSRQHVTDQRLQMWFAGTAFHVCTQILDQEGIAILD